MTSVTNKLINTNRQITHYSEAGVWGVGEGGRVTFQGIV